MKNRALFVLLLFLCLLFLFSCSSARDQLVGRWETETEDDELGKVLLVYHFTDKGEIFLEQRDGDRIPFSIPFGTYAVHNDEITINDGNDTVRYLFSVEEDTLYFSVDGNCAMTFRRVS